MDQELLNTILTAVVVPILIALTGFIVAFINKKIEELKVKVQAQELAKYIDIAEDAIVASVSLVSQTVVDYLKANGGWNEEAAKEAFATARGRAIVIMGSSAIKALSLAYGDFDAWLDAKIEEAVREGKAALPPVVPTPVG
jgi:hypothetical protein